MIVKSTRVLGFHTSRVSQSVLELRLKAAGISWTPNWTFLGRSSYGIFDQHVGAYHCGHAPPIYTYESNSIPAAATDAELRALAQTLQAGTETEQKALLIQLADRSTSRPVR